jgi:hypothetical protein
LIRFRGNAYLAKKAKTAPKISNIPCARATFSQGGENSENKRKDAKV